MYVAFMYHNTSKLVITLSFTGYDCGFTWFMKPGFQLYPHCHCHYYYYAGSRTPSHTIPQGNFIDDCHLNAIVSPRILTYILPILDAVLGPNQGSDQFSVGIPKQILNLPASAGSLKKKQLKIK